LAKKRRRYVRKNGIFNYFKFIVAYSRVVINKAQTHINSFKQLSDQVAPLIQKKKKKESEKERARSNGAHEEEIHQSTLSEFKADVDRLQKITLQIDSYMNSTKSQDLEQNSSAVADIVDKIKAKGLELEEVEPKLQRLKRAADDKERHKNLLRQNIDILEATAQTDAVKRDLSELQRQREKIAGSATAGNEYNAALHKKELLQQKKSNFEGRHTSHMDQYYALKVR
jgi:hypothetical protein